MKASIKNIVLPDAPAPTRAVYKKPVVGTYAPGMRVIEIPSVYHPKPAPMPRPRPKTIRPEKTRGAGKREVHRGPTFWTEDKIQKVVEMYEAGATFREIGDVYGKSWTAIRNVITRLARSGIVERKGRPEMTPEDVERIRELRDEGKTFEEIGDIVGWSRSAVYNAYREGTKC